ncbi:MAG: hypothetical protein DWQ45_24635 [Planctomycetota bacterium]|nr:MAG: hypothetical protein DWQ29_14705 [Planctomycetota bacterium]REK20501.1 MAG: hypothetical protein DWQ41_24725 [Planctomycetota bacterium]REK28255.1 MAG: hypothetical protein DWQ45_24635 [Planctomycetota bacterium]
MLCKVEKARRIHDHLADFFRSQLSLIYRLKQLNRLVDNLSSDPSRSRPQHFRDQNRNLIHLPPPSTEQDHAQTRPRSRRTREKWTRTVFGR